MKNIDFKSISLGLLIYLLGIVLFPYIAAFFMASIFQLDEGYLRDIEGIIEYLVWYLSILLSGYGTALLAGTKKLQNSLIVGIIIMIFSVIGTVSDIYNPKGDPFLQNALGDLLIIPVILIGSKIGSRKKAPN